MSVMAWVEAATAIRCARSSLHPRHGGELSHFDCASGRMEMRVALHQVDRGVSRVRVEDREAGARYAQGVKGPRGRRIAADIEITELEPGSVIAFQTITGPVRPRGRCLLTPTDGGTRVRFELEAKVSGLKRLMAPMVQNTMNAEVGHLDHLKQVLER
jgi:uncharacterized protein YndB with AHSA1/START domain